jgi:tetratricopeptide (TPR) repeat protein
MPLSEAGLAIDELLPQLTCLENDTERREFLARSPSLVRKTTLELLAPLVVKQIRVDAREALHLAEVVLLIARELRDQEGIALALRAKANALYARGENRSAAEHHAQACEIYKSHGNWMEAARTLSSSIQPQILLGEYDRAFDASQEAQRIFTRLKEPKRIANLENNIGNIFHRQDLYEEALLHYEHAYNALAAYEEWEHATVALSNMAMCLISLNDFPRSLECYHKARDLCIQHNMPRLRDQADYNIAYLHYFRGEYNRAIEMLFATQRACEVSDDAYHLALCHLDLSEIYLELNLSQEAQERAREAFLGFQKLDMRYEAAKALANEAIAYGQQRKTQKALDRFTSAREMFAQENNKVWPWLLDLYQGVLMFWESRYPEARQLCIGAAKFFDETKLSGKAVLSHLLLARIALKLGEVATAATEVRTALGKVPAIETPVLIYETHLVLAHTALLNGDQAAARTAYEEARGTLENLRTRLQGEELKISFIKSRLEVYDALTDLYLTARGDGISTEEVFSCMEAAKSRSMMELIFRSGESLPFSETDSSQLCKIRDLRAELNWYYHRIELEQLRPEGMSRERIERLQRQVQAREKALLRAQRDLPSTERESANIEVPTEFQVTELQSAIPADTALVEYYSTGDRLLAAVLTRDTIAIEPLGELARVERLLQLLRFQLSKFQMGGDYTGQFAKPLLVATLGHLESLYDELIKPLRSLLRAHHLVFVPHGPLHFLPFHALRNGGEFIGDSYAVSYAPSATVFALCQRKAPAKKHSSLILAVADDRAPQIKAEVECVAALLPQADVYIGPQATSDVLREKGSDATFVHIATHGMYRQDNPMFSGIRLSDGYLNLYDLYRLRLNARLVTLSGCATGMNFVAAGDELLGLQRGLLYAGATSLLLSLWDVHDRSTAELMQEFYRRYIQTGDTAASLQAAARCLREQNPHPYFWAPFVLVGKVETQPATG